MLIINTIIAFQKLFLSESKYGKMMIIYFVHIHNLESLIIEQ